jgi:hypothetical protein
MRVTSTETNPSHDVDLRELDDGATTTPPPELRTDPERGTGELGIEGMDGLAPLPAPEPCAPRMCYLYGSKPGVARRLVATFSSEAQLLAYVRWATLAELSDGSTRFEQGTPLASFRDYEYSSTPLTGEDAEQVLHNPTPSML